MKNFKDYLKESEEIVEGNDKSPEDLQNNHPDIHKFISSITGPYSIRNAKVSSFDMGGQHHVSVVMQPSAGIRNTIAVLEGTNIKFNVIEGQFTRPRVEGTTSGFDFVITDDGKSGNITEEWRFDLTPTMEEDKLQEGEPIVHGDFYWAYKCPRGHIQPYEGSGAPEFAIRPCPECGAKASATKIKTTEVAEDARSPSDDEYNRAAMIVKNKTGAQIDSIGVNADGSINVRANGKAYIVRGDKLDIAEAKSDSLGRKFNKAFWWDGYSTPKDIMERVRKMTDQELIDLADNGIDDQQPGGAGTPREFQIKIIKRELKRRFGVQPGPAGLEEGDDFDPTTYEPTDDDFYDDGQEDWEREADEAEKGFGNYEDTMEEELNDIKKLSGLKEDEPTLSDKEKNDGWIVRNGVKMKIGKARPFKPSDMNTEPTDSEMSGWARKSSRNTDDGSHGLSARDRNR